MPKMKEIEERERGRRERERPKRQTINNTWQMSLFTNKLEDHWLCSDGVVNASRVDEISATTLES